MDNKKGVLLINIGTPEAPTEEAVRVFLADFLSDPYVVDYPRWLWKPILEKIILRVRPARSAQLYEKIWEETGSPLLNISHSIEKKLQEKLPNIELVIGMRYGKPSIEKGLGELAERGVEELLIFPLFPQYSSTTSQTAIEHSISQITHFPQFQSVSIIDEYHAHPTYIRALAESIRTNWAKDGKPDKLVFSYHSVPQRYISKKGEPYQTQCINTTELVARELGLDPSDYFISYQSKFGPEKWLAPNTDELLHKMGEEGVESVNVICPGFSADCLETLEEIAIQGRDSFIVAGEKKFSYISALNDKILQIEALERIISEKFK